MTYSKEITLWCDEDGCKAWERFAKKTVTYVVDVARERGWTSPEWDEHYCPDCSENDSE